MFSVVQICETYNLRGDVSSTTETPVGEFADALDMYAHVYGNPEIRHGYLLKLNDRQRVRWEKRFNGERVTFAEIFRMVEGEEAFRAVDEERAPAVNEEDWVAAKLATR